MGGARAVGTVGGGASGELLPSAGVGVGACAAELDAIQHI